MFVELTIKTLLIISDRFYSSMQLSLKKKGKKRTSFQLLDDRDLNL